MKSLFYDDFCIVGGIFNNKILLTPTNFYKQNSSTEYNVLQNLILTITQLDSISLSFMAPWAEKLFATMYELFYPIPPCVQRNQFRIQCVRVGSDKSNPILLHVECGCTQIANCSIIGPDWVAAFAIFQQ
jgi:hypothetical protein